MAEITLKYDARNPLDKKALDLFLALGLFEEEKKKESHYSKELVEKIKRGEKSKNWTAIKTEDLWK